MEGGAPAELVASGEFQQLSGFGSVVEFVEFLVEFLAEPTPADGDGEVRHKPNPRRCLRKEWLPAAPRPALLQP